MARRRQLEAPTSEALKEIEDGFARETRRDPLGLSAPIASVAAEAAALSQPGSAEERTDAARDKRDAERLRAAEQKGLLAVELSLGDIVQDELIRDRMALDPAEMDELKTSIAAHGLRLPIEVFELAEPRDGARFALLSGYRRLTAVQSLHSMTGRPEYATIRALVRRPESVPDAFVSMVEENEIRAGLSQYERGRVAVLAVEHGAFDTVEQSVNVLFHAGSKAKRSKLRSFALIHEELGDMLVFPQALSERMGLRIANALRTGLVGEMREALATGQGVDAELEWALLEPILLTAEAGPRDERRAGRPRVAAARPAQDRGSVALANGVSIRHETDRRGHLIRFEGRRVDTYLIESVIAEIKRLLEPI